MLRDREAVGAFAAEMVAEAARSIGTGFVLGVATGSSPVPTYEHLARAVANGELDLSGARAFALDEYVGLPPGHPQSYAEVVRRTVTEPLRMRPERVLVPNGFADDLETAARDFERSLAGAGGLDVQVLGIGTDGHVGFNEPGVPLTERTHVGTLAESTRRDNARFFGSLDQVPHQCLTQGLGTIMGHRHVILVADGQAKARAVADMVEGDVSIDCPGSVLQGHPHVTVLLDPAAASRLT